MTGLKDALQELADRPRPDAGGQAAPAELWTRGVRRYRWRAAAAAVATIAVVAAGAGIGVLVNHSQDIAPTGGTSGAHLPKSVGVPDPGSAGTDDAGPLGPLAVLWQASRHGQDGNGIFGISASTGTYRFLDLPKIAGPSDVALSPDGREVAYWTTGPVTGEPITPVGIPDDRMATVTGIARYDTVTGKTRFRPIASPHGLDPEGIQWSDDDIVLFQYGRVISRTSADGIATWSWGVGGEPHRVTKPVDLDAWTPTRNGGHGFATAAGFSWLPAGATRRDEATAIRGIPAVGWAALTTSGAYVAGIRAGPQPGYFNGKGGLRVGRLRAGAVHQMRRIRGVRPAVIVGWTDRKTLIVVTTVSSSDVPHRLVSIDVATDDIHEVGTVRNPQGWPVDPQYATSLLTRPFVARPVPVLGESHWRAAGWGALVAVVLVGGFVLWRRRARG